jgi:malonyl-CoA decarboxylase
VDDLKRDLPGLKQFATLSPIPRLKDWVRAHPEALADAFTDADWKKLAPLGIEGPASAGFQSLLDDNCPWLEQPGLPAALSAPLTRLAARYLCHAKSRGAPFDPVARFHLGNGARVERLNWMADSAERGMSQSFGLMVNYLYDPDRIESNVEAYVADGAIAASGSIKRLAKL